MPENMNADDLLRMGYVDDALLLEDVSLCQLCTHTCRVTTVKPVLPIQS